MYFNRLVPAPIGEQSAEGGVYGYVWRYYRLSNNQIVSTHRQEMERLIAWARREYAEANLLSEHGFTIKEHRKPYYKRDYFLLTITDPVAQRLEKLIAAQKERE